jgi:hypothetical protein
LLEGVIPVLIFLTGVALILQCSFGVDLTGVGVTLGGASLIVGFATSGSEIQIWLLNINTFCPKLGSIELNF